MPTRFPASKRFEIYLHDSKNPKWRWRLDVKGKSTIATSHQGHKYKEDCEDEIDLVKQSEKMPVYKKLNGDYDRIYDLD